LHLKPQSSSAASTVADLLPPVADALWLLILGYLGAAVYLNQVGLQFLKRPLLENCAPGLTPFSRLRWQWIGNRGGARSLRAADDP